MTEREEQADRNRPLAGLHQLARHIVDGGDVIGIDRVAQAERVGEQRGAEQHRMVAEGDQRPQPGQQVGRYQNGVNGDDAAAQIVGAIVKKLC